MDREKSKTFMNKLNLNTLLQKKYNNNSNEKFETIEDRINIVEKKIKSLNNRMDEYDDKFNDLLGRIYNLFLDINESSKEKLDDEKLEIKKLFLKYSKLS